MDKLIFELKHVYFAYGGRYPALDDINIQVRVGEKIAVVGANGCGKSTLLHMLDGLIFAQQGKVAVLGQTLTENAFNGCEFSKTFRKKVGLVFQNPDVQLFCPTVREDIFFGPLQLGLDLKETQQRMEELVKFLGLESLLDRSPHQLSLGEKRKVALVSTLIMDPEVLLLDEPTAGLDPLTVRHIIDLLLKMNEAGKTIITSTHDLHIVEEIADTIFVFSQNKKIVDSGPANEILKNDALLREHNLVHVHRHRHQGLVHVHSHQHLDHHH